MAPTERHLVVDGSNIATEGRTLPSLAQLDEAVRAITAEYTYESLTVIVDATFAHRIDESERAEFEEAVLAGEIVTPPAGAIGRGDAFILQVAEKVGAVVFSNDSFQEFHGEHDWLFQEGRLIGGKPIEGVGWVFVARSPVRGPASRRSVREAGGGARRTRSRSGGGSGSGRGRSGSRSKATGPAPKPSKSTPPPKKSVAKATKRNDDSPASTRGRKKASAAPKQAQNKGASKSGSAKELNDPTTFMMFVTRHSIGDEVEGVVERFSSHGCYLIASGAQCYLPSRKMGDPPPSRARDVVAQGQTVIVKVESLDSDRRGINVKLVRAVPQDGEESKQGRSNKEPRDSRTTANRDLNPAKTPQEPLAVADDEGSHEGHLTRSTTNVATPKATAGKRAAKASKRGGAKKRPAKSTATATSSDRVKRAAARKNAAKPGAKKAAPKKSGAKKTTAAKRTTKKSTAKKTTAKKTTTKKSTAKKTGANKTAAKRTTKKSTGKKTGAKKTAAKGTTKSTAKKTTSKRTTKKTAAKKPAAAKRTTKKSTAKKTAAKKPATAKKG